jgi:hypothetical protein
MTLARPFLAPGVAWYRGPPGFAASPAGNTADN